MKSIDTIARDNKVIAVTLGELRELLLYISSKTDTEYEFVKNWNQARRYHGYGVYIHDEKIAVHIKPESP